MPHEVELIATIAIGFALAFAFGFIAIRLGLPPCRLSRRGSVHRPIDSGIRGRSRDGWAARRDRRDSAHVRRWPSFFHSRPDGGAPDCDPGCDRADHYRNGYWRKHDNAVGLELWSGLGPGIISFGGEHGRPAQGA